MQPEEACALTGVFLLMYTDRDRGLRYRTDRVSCGHPVRQAGLEAAKEYFGVLGCVISPSFTS